MVVSEILYDLAVMELSDVLKLFVVFHLNGEDNKLFAIKGGLSEEFEAFVVFGLVGKLVVGFEDFLSELAEFLFRIGLF